MPRRCIDRCAAPADPLRDHDAKRDDRKQHITRCGFDHHLIQMIIAGIALRTDVFRLFQSPEIMPNRGILVYIGRIGTIVFCNNFCLAAAE